MVKFLSEFNRIFLDNLKDPRFYRFLAIGLINTAFGYSIYALFLFIGMHYAIAGLFGTVLGVIFNFFTTGALVFSVVEGKRLFKFAGVYVVTYFCNIAGIKILFVMGFNYYYGGALMIPPMAILAFLLNKYWVFKEVANEEN